MELSPPAALGPEALHPALWRAAQWGQARQGTSASGWPELDLLLPGGGWPHRALAELLLAQPGLGELRLLTPLLAAAADAGRPVMLLNPPAQPCAWAWAALGLDTRQLLLVPGTRTATDTLWALEQALGSGQLGPVLAWLPPRLSIDTLRRLQLAAQAHDAPALLLREPQAAQRPSVAPLRLLLQPAGVGWLQVQVLKRRGPPVPQPLVLPLQTAPGLPQALPVRQPPRPAAVPAVRQR